MRDHLLVEPQRVGAAAVGVEVVEQAAGLVLFRVEAGEAQQAARVVAGVDDLGLDAHLGAALGRLDRELLDVEAEVVEALDAVGDAPALGAVENVSLPVSSVQSAAVLRRRCRSLTSTASRSSSRRPPASRSSSSPAMLTRAISRSFSRWPFDRPPVVELAGLGVDQVRGEGAGVAAEERVRQRDVAPEEADDVQPHEQHARARRRAAWRCRVAASASRGRGRAART